MNELIKQIQHKLASEVEWVKDERTIPESSHRRCTRKGGGSAQSSHWVRDTCDKSAHPIVGRKAPMTGVSTMITNKENWPKCPVKLESRSDRRRAWKLESASNLTNPGLGETKRRATSERPQIPLKCSSAGCSEAQPDHVAKDIERKVETATQSVSLLEGHSIELRLLSKTFGPILCGSDPWVNQGWFSQHVLTREPQPHRDWWHE